IVDGGADGDTPAPPTSDASTVPIEPVTDGGSEQPGSDAASATELEDDAAVSDDGSVRDAAATPSDAAAGDGALDSGARDAGPDAANLDATVDAGTIVT